MNPPATPEDVPDRWYGLEDEARDRARVADRRLPIDDRVQIAIEWASCWAWAVEFALHSADPDFRVRAIEFYAERAQWWDDACTYLLPEVEAAEGDQ